MTGVRRWLVGGAAAYLGLGLLLGLADQPQQMWQCRDPSGWGVVNHSTPRPGCRATVSVGDRLEVAGVTAVLWLPLLVGEGVGNAGGA